jgi:tRNA pseudouridine38-40 synthase
MNADFMDPFINRYAAKIFYMMDVDLMKKAAKPLFGRHDFKAFQAAGGVEKNSVRTVKKIKIEKCGDLIYIDIEADGFLYNMARNIVGTLVEVGRGKFASESVKHILHGKDRKLCGPTMPAKGLCLIRVRY